MVQRVVHVQILTSDLTSDLTSEVGAWKLFSDVYYPDIMCIMITVSYELVLLSTRKFSFYPFRQMDRTKHKRLISFLSPCCREHAVSPNTV